MKEWFSELWAQARNAAPLVAGQAYSWYKGITIDGLTSVIMLVYAIGQVAYLIWRWRRDIRKGKQNAQTPKP